MDNAEPGSGTRSQGRWDPDLYDSRHSFVSRYGEELVELLAPAPGERILDVGCGTGYLASRIAEAGARVLGIDISPEMVQRARRSYPGLEFQIADAASFRFSDPFDAVFSNAALHWVQDPEAAVECIQQALRPGGRLVAELGGMGNIGSIVSAFREVLAATGYPRDPEESPWYFPSIAQFASLLESRGLFLTYAWLFPRPTPLEDGERGLRNWVRMFAGRFMEDVPVEAREAVLRGVESRLRGLLYRDGTWVADYVRLRIVAIKG